MKTSLLAIGVAVTIIPVAAMIAFIKAMGADVAKVTAEEFKKAAMQSARQATVDIRQMCDVIQLADENRSALARNAIQDALKELGEPSLERYPVEREMRNQYVPETIFNRKIRLVKFGDEAADPALPPDSPENAVGNILLRLKERLNCDFTIYTRISRDGDMLRSATTKADSEGNSMAGVYMPGTLKNGARPRLTSALLAGAEYYDIVDSEGSPFMANYMPILDRRGEVIGAISYGMRQNSMAEIEKFLQSYTMGESGSVWIVDEGDPAGAILRISSDSSASGMRVDDDPIAARRDFLKRAIAKSKNLRSGEIAAETMVIPLGEGRPDAQRLMTFTYYKPWKWIIGTSTNGDEFQEGENALRSQTALLIRQIIFIGIVFTAIAIGVAWVLSSTLSKPLKMMANVARANSRGDIAGAELIITNYTRRKKVPIVEFGRLLDAILDMSRRLSAVIAGVRESGKSISDRAAEVAEAAEKLESISEYESSGVRRVTGAGKSISTSYDSLNKTAVGAAKEVEKTLRTSRAGGENISLLKRNYDSLTASAENVAERLDQIRESVSKITEVISAINEISRRTNLLSLNASIEAEKAGESGLGFSVVARQIRSLADKTSKASEDIEDIAGQLRESVDLGAADMDHFLFKMKQNSSAIIKTADSLERVVRDVESIGPKFKDIANGIAELSQKARKISAVMENLRSESQKAANRISDFKAATESLNSTSSILLDEVARFSISGRRGRK